MTDLTQPICFKCGEVHCDQGKGLWHFITNPCAGNRSTYHIFTGRKMFEKLNELFDKMREGIDLNNLISFELFPHLRPIGNIFHPLDEQLFHQAREYEIISVLRLQRWIEIEEEFSYKY